MAGAVQRPGWDRPACSAHVRFQGECRPLAYAARSRDYPWRVDRPRCWPRDLRRLRPEVDRERPGLRPKTVQLYRYLLRSHLLPTLGAKSIADIRESHVRRWRKERLDAGVKPVTLAKAYRLLKAILNTAVDDELIRRNPCRLKGASVEQSPERPILTARQVFDLAAAIDSQYHALVLLAVFSSMRWGELAGLQRRDIDLAASTVHISRQLVELRGGGFAFAPLKSDAGKRVVVIPAAIASIIRQHIDGLAGADDVLIFTSPEGKPLRHGNFRRRVWRPALKAAGLPMIHLHDLRHTGNMLAAGTGAGLRELMDRMGHSTPRAALIYLHASDERQRAIADALSKITTTELARRTPERSGTQRARKRQKTQ